MTCIAALGEEIGWSGFLVPQLAKQYRFTTVALARGVIWSVWHYPMIIAGVYANQTPVWFNLICFTLVITGISFCLHLVPAEIRQSLDRHVLSCEPQLVHPILFHTAHDHHSTHRVFY